jgi:RNA polymerase sigma factor (sigma-70 family)
MSRIYKTSKKKRTNYIYYGDGGSKTVLTPGENGVTEAMIETLHSLDDEAVDEERRETRRHSTLDELNDKSKFLKDLYVDVEDEVFTKVEREAIKKLIHEALAELKPKQQELIKCLYLSDKPMTQKEYAEKNGVAEDSVKKQALRVRNKLKEKVAEKMST